MTSDRESLRAVFDEDAEAYERARPRYPEVVFDAIDEAVGTRRRVLEIGCGTGQATLPLARRGYEILAVELGPAMAARARRNLATFPRVEVVTADVEHPDIEHPDIEHPDIEHPDGGFDPFDAVVCATAFHWLDPTTRLDRIARLLRPGGVAALIATLHVAGPCDDFFAASQRCYERWDPATPPDVRLVGLDDLPAAGQYGLETAAGFVDGRVTRFPLDVRYTADEYLDLLDTFSGHRALAPERRRGLYACLRALFDAQPDGTVVRSSAIELTTAVRAGRG